MDSILKCPVCDHPLVKNNKSYLCDKGHSFDIAKQGYVNLLQSQASKVKIHGDSNDMLMARKNILYKGYYQSISKKLNEVIGLLALKDTIIDIGSGIGYYLDMLEKKLPSSNYYGIDISKDGIKIAARNNKKLLYTVGSNNKLPYTSNTADVIYAVFSPINTEECIRVLKAGGKLITVSPNTNHLMELKELVYEEIVEKDYLVNEIENSSLQNELKVTVKDFVHITDGDLYHLFMMTPHFWKTPLEVKEKIKKVKEFDVSIDVAVNVYSVK